MGKALYGFTVTFAIAVAPTESSTVVSDATTSGSIVKDVMPLPSAPGLAIIEALSEYT